MKCPIWYIPALGEILYEFKSVERWYFRRLCDLDITDLFQIRAENDGDVLPYTNAT